MRLCQPDAGVWLVSDVGGGCGTAGRGIGRIPARSADPRSSEGTVKQQ